MYLGVTYLKSKKYWEYEVNVMKKQVFLRGIIGVFIGISLGYLITIFISLGFADGYYVPCIPALADTIGSQIGAVAFQAFLCAVLGFVFGASSVIWEIDHWSIVKQTGIYFAIITATMLPIAYVTHWMEHSIEGVLLYVAIFFAIFVVIWLIQYIIWKNKIKKINAQIQHRD